VAFPSFLSALWFGEPLWIWLSFVVVLGSMLIFDLGVSHKQARAISIRESIITSTCYTLVAVLFGAWVWWKLGHDKAFDFYTGYAVELSLSLDNVFVIAMILAYFRIPQQFQYKVLFWGILGAVVLRGIMVFAGIAILYEMEYVLYLFAAFLIYSGIKMALASDNAQIDLSHNRILHFLETHLRVSKTFNHDKFFILKENRHNKHVWYITPLLLALVMVEMVDVLFAMDSIPAIFAITRDPFIVISSNIFAIIGLRSLYFSLSAMLNRFYYMKYALAALLVLIGSKMIISDMLGWVHISSLQSLSMTIVVLLAGAGYSIFKTRMSQ